jgi:hypothetical protein
MKRRSVREKYIDRSPIRKEAMLAVIGLWTDRTDLPNTATYIRELRRDDRLERQLR